MTLVPTEVSFYYDNCDVLPVSLEVRTGAADAEEGGLNWSLPANYRPIYVCP